MEPTSRSPWLWDLSWICLSSETSMAAVRSKQCLLIDTWNSPGKLHINSRGEKSSILVNTNALEGSGSSQAYWLCNSSVKYWCVKLWCQMKHCQALDRRKNMFQATVQTILNVRLLLNLVKLWTERPATANTLIFWVFLFYLNDKLLLVVLDWHELQLRKILT